MKSGDFHLGCRIWDSVVDVWFSSTPPRLHVSDLIHATVVEWLPSGRDVHAAWEYQGLAQE